MFYPHNVIILQLFSLYVFGFCSYANDTPLGVKSPKIRQTLYRWKGNSLRILNMPLFFNIPVGANTSRTCTYYTSGVFLYVATNIL